jgi:membrane protein implicated in regulation of membrane protease activity
MYFYVICLVVGLVFTLLCAIFGHFFGGHDADVGDVGGADGSVGTGGHAEAGFADSGVPALSFFSPTVLATFVTAFGAIGTILSSIDSVRGKHLIIATIAASGGMAIAWVALMVFNTAFRKMQGSSESRVSRLIGQEANVITAIPAGGVGEIAYIQSGTRYNAPARTENGQPVAAGQLVRIKRVVGTQFYVEPLAEK